MMDIKRIFAHALARRLAFVLAAAALSWFGLGDVKAQSYPYCLETSVPVLGQCPTREEAYRTVRLGAIDKANRQYAGLLSEVGYKFVPPDSVEYRVKTKDGYEIAEYRSWLTACPSGTSWDDNTKACSCPTGQIKNSETGKCMQSCSSRGTFTRTFASQVANGSIGCVDGCLTSYHVNADGSFTGEALGDGPNDHCTVIPNPNKCSDNGVGWFFNYGLSMCVPPSVECAANEVKNPATGQCTQGCPLGKVMDSSGTCKIEENACPAGQVKGPDGSCVQDSCPAGQVKGPDGTCKKSEDGDKDEGDEDKYFSGGDNCNAPPACSGDAILCGQARIQWRIDCNTRRNVNIAGGSCTAAPVCTGDKCDAMEYAQLMQQWRTACALEKLAKGEGGEGEGDDKQPGWTKVDGMNQDAGAGQTGDDVKGVQTKTISTSDLDASGWLGGGGSCPAIMSAGGDGLGGSFAQALASPPSYFCNFIGMMHAIVMMGAAYVAAFILSKG